MVNRRDSAAVSVKRAKGVPFRRQRPPSDEPPWWRRFAGHIISEADDRLYCEVYPTRWPCADATGLNGSATICGHIPRAKCLGS